MGTLSSDWVAGKKLAVSAANAAGKPWVLDPVGCGATPYRTAACRDILTRQPAVVRGNASEIMALSGAAGAGFMAGQPAAVDRPAKCVAGHAL
eukprot:349632-Chlamydomonas_euryale.AAC.59